MPDIGPDLETQVAGVAGDTVFLRAESHGRDSIIHDYLKDAIQSDHEECLWICYPQGRRIIAKDIALPSDENSFQLHNLAKSYGWWKRWSLYSAVGVKDVEVKVECGNADQQMLILR